MLIASRRRSGMVGRSRHKYMWSEGGIQGYVRDLFEKKYGIRTSQKGKQYLIGLPEEKINW